MQDVIELRQNGWKKRREDAGPKTIDQIHKEVEKEQMEQKLQHMTSSMGPPPARRQKDVRQIGSRPARFQEKINPSRPTNSLGSVRQVGSNIQLFLRQNINIFDLYRQVPGGCAARDGQVWRG